MNEEGGKSILSWRDQVKKENVKILEPTLNEEKEEKVINRYKWY